ncbi:MAG: hypothetical protein R3185_08565, partial [Candidatus Thermoplasmatota archaeon]|nr:hypothetical protein [Candidatus Thermoplasmatota archaeon]
MAAAAVLIMASLGQFVAIQETARASQSMDALRLAMADQVDLIEQATFAGQAFADQLSNLSDPEGELSEALSAVEANALQLPTLSRRAPGPAQSPVLADRTDAFLAAGHALSRSTPGTPEAQTRQAALQTAGDALLDAVADHRSTHEQAYAAAQARHEAWGFALFGVGLVAVLGVAAGVVTPAIKGVRAREAYHRDRQADLEVEMLEQAEAAAA